MSQLFLPVMTVHDHRPMVAAQRRERMQARLVGAAYSLAAEQGLDAVTIDAVISRAEVARGTFYKYFESPAQLLQAVGQEVSDSLITTMNPVVSRIEDPAERIAVGVRTVLHLVGQHPSLGRFMARSGWPAVALTPLFYAVVGSTLADGISIGRFSPMPTELALSAVAGTLLGAMHAQAGGQMPQNLPELTAAAVLRALGLADREAFALASAALPISTRHFAPLFVSRAVA